METKHTMRTIQINTSINGRVLVEPYKKTELKAEIRSGMAMISQKVNLKGLKLMADACIPSGMLGGIDLKAGDIAYFREDQLHMCPGIKDVLNADTIEGPFIILDANMIQFVRQTVPEPRSLLSQVQVSSDEL